MKKQLITLAFAAVGFISMNAFAQAPSNKEGKARRANNTECVNPAQCANPNECKAKRPVCNPFEGLNLTDAQKTKLEAIPNPRKVAQEMKQAAKADSIKTDKAAVKAMRKDIRSNYLRQVKDVLSADQYVTFLENYFVNAPASGKHHKDIKGNRGGKKFDKAQRQGKGQGKNGKQNRQNKQNKQNNQAQQSVK